MSGPLDGVRVLDLTNMIVGPYGTQILGDLGAEVIKVEPPGGDNVRGLGPPRHPGMGPVYLHVNRSKRCLVLDLKKPAAREAVLRLGAAAAVFIHNVRPKAMARLGLTYDAVARVNPRIVYCNAVGFGPGGRYADKAAYDELVQGVLGIPYLQARIGGEPRYVPFLAADRTVGIAVAQNVCAALFHRERAGEGQEITVPMFEVMAHYLLSDHMYGRTFEPATGAAGYVRSLVPERRPFKTRDGYICALTLNDQQWRRFCDLVGRPDMKTDPRYADLNARTAHTAEVYGFIAETIATKTTDDWLALFEEADVPAMPMHDIDGLMADPHLADVGFISLADHPSEGRVRNLGVPTVWSKSVPEAGRPAPRLGEHSAEILREAGYDADEIAALAADGATLLAPETKEDPQKPRP